MIKSERERNSTYLENSQFDESRIRGETVHECLENYLTTGQPGDGGKYNAWVEKLINYPMWGRFRVIATELRMVDRIHDIAGTLDCLLENRKTKEIWLVDLKTRNEKFSKGNYRKQLGGYLSLLYTAYPFIHVDKCRVIYATPKEVVTTDYDPMECLELYEQARSAYFASTQLPI